MTETERERLLTVHEVAACLRVSEEAIRRWLRAGELRGYRLTEAAGWRVPEAAVRELLERRTAGGSAGPAAH